MDDWEWAEQEYAAGLTARVEVLLARVSEIPRRYVESARALEERFLREFEETAGVVGALQTSGPAHRTLDAARRALETAARAGDEHARLRASLGGLLTLAEIEQLATWVGGRSFRLLGAGDAPAVRVERGRGVVCLMLNQNSSVFGFFTRAGVVGGSDWALPKDCELCFSMRSLFSKVPVVLLRKAGGRVDPAADVEMVSLMMIEMNGSHSRRLIYAELTDS